MTNRGEQFNVLVLGHVWEVDHIFSQAPFVETYPAEPWHESDPDRFIEAASDPDVDVIIMNLEPHGIETLEDILAKHPMRPMIMVADADKADGVIEAKKKGLERYVIRLEHGDTNIRLLASELESIIERMAAPPKLDHPTVDTLFRFAQYHNVDQAFFLIDANRRLIYFNEAGQKFVRSLHDRAPRLGKPIGEFPLEASADEFEAHLERAFARQKVETSRRFEGMPLEETHRTLSYQPIVTDRGDVLAVSISSTNIGRQIEAERRAEEAMRLHALGELAGGVAHDFNNVLSIVAGYSHIVADGLQKSDTDDLQRHLSKINKAVERGSALTEQLMIFGRDTGLGGERVDLNEHVTSTAHLLARTLGEQFEVSTELDPDLGAIEATSSEIDQVLMNLAVNARDAMPEGGTLWLRTRPVTFEDEPPHPGLAADRRYSLLEVSDTGVGISREHQRRIFESFYTTKERGQGVGLGLSIVYKLVDRIGGVIDVDSAPGEGTTFRLYFPAEPITPAELEARGLGAPAVEEPHQECILLVEDEEDLREAFRHFLESRDYAVVEAGNVADALELAERLSDQLDLLLTDVVLPDGQGIAIAEQLFDVGLETPVIFMSGYAPSQFYERLQSLDADFEFVAKPLVPGVLLEAVDRALKHPNQDDDSAASPPPPA